MGEAVAIEVRGLQKVEDERLILNLEVLQVGRGEIAALVGPVGSGKETLFDLLIGRARPTVGMVRLAGHDPALDHYAMSYDVGVLFGGDNLYLSRSAQGNLSFFARLYGLAPSRVDQVIAEVGLLDHAQVRAAKLAPGLRRRLAFGRAVLHEPAVLLLVNPFSQCDEASIVLLMSFISWSGDPSPRPTRRARSSTLVCPLGSPSVLRGASCWSIRRTFGMPWWRTVVPLSRRWTVSCPRSSH
jgi:ABC-2 type transport system ATP-binding protein